MKEPPGVNLKKKHHHDLTESYKLTCDSEQLITDKEKFNELRPIPLSALEDFFVQKLCFTSRYAFTRTEKEEE